MSAEGRDRYLCAGRLDAFTLRHPATIVNTDIDKSN